MELPGPFISRQWALWGALSTLCKKRRLCPSFPLKSFSHHLKPLPSCVSRSVLSLPPPHISLWFPLCLPSVSLFLPPSPPLSPSALCFLSLLSSYLMVNAIHRLSLTSDESPCERGHSCPHFPDGETETQGDSFSLSQSTTCRLLGFFSSQGQRKLGKSELEGERQL